jgi:hypothetical protein
MGAVADAVSSVTDAVSDVVSTVGDAVSDVGNAVVTQVVEPVVKAVDNTIKAAEKDPIGTIAQVTAAVYAPYLLPAVSAANTMAHGGSLEDGLKAAAVSYVAVEAGNYVSSELSSTSTPMVDMELGPTPTITPNVPPPPIADPTVAKLAGSTASGATRAALTGKDPVSGAASGLTSGVVSAGTSAGAKEISDTNFEDWSRTQAQNANENAPSPTELDVLAADNTIPLPPPTTTTATGPGYYNEATGEFVPSEIGTTPLDNTSGANLDSMKDYKYDTATNTWTSPDGEVISLNDLSNTQTPLDTSLIAPTEKLPEAYDPVNAKPALKFAANAVLQKTAADKAAADRAAQANQTTQSNNLLGLLALLDTKAPQAPVQNQSNDIKYFYDIMGNDILPPTPQKTEKPVFNYAEGGTIEDLIRMLRS